MLGVNENDGMVFQGRGKQGAHLIWPIPVMIPTQFIESTSENLIEQQVSAVQNYLFREDSFDAVSRIRRGRIYRADGPSGSGWTVFPSPFFPIPFSPNKFGLIDMSAADYSSCTVERLCNIEKIQNPIAILGRGKSSTIWSIVHVETIFTGDELVTLKARQSMGVLPALQPDKIPAQSEASVREALQTLEDDFHLASPESIVDRANEAATRILNAFLESEKRKSEDSLNKAIEAAKKFNKEVVTNAADIVRRLHSRTKYAVQRAKELRVIREQDAELAVQCIGVMLCDLEWAEWR